MCSWITNRMLSRIYPIPGKTHMSDYESDMRFNYNYIERQSRRFGISKSSEL